MTGCSGSVSIGGSASVPKQTVENQVATTLAQQNNQPVPKVVCPGDLKSQIGTVMYCSATAPGSTTAYTLKVRVDSVSGSQVHFSIVVGSTAEGLMGNGGTCGGLQSTPCWPPPKP